MINAMNAELELAAYAAVQNLKAAGLTAATAESCTGGLIAALLTGVPGASAVFRYGWVTYCNEAKENMLRVPHDALEQHSAVSEPVVQAMAENALQLADADLAVAVSGNAGPTKGAPNEPPVGTVCIALARKGHPTRTETIFHPNLTRTAFRSLVASRALELLSGERA